MNDLKFMDEDLTNRICEFGARYLGMKIDPSSDTRLFQVATDLFWDNYFDGYVEL